jgi:hypothetical protein
VQPALMRQTSKLLRQPSNNRRPSATAASVGAPRTMLALRTKTDPC